MTYQQALDYLYKHLPMFQRVGPAAYKKDLTNITKLCSYLGDPQLSFECVHLAGTNGKGSVSHFLAACLQAAGYKVGVYTSPHYKDFRERIKINGELLPEAFVTDFVQDHREALEAIEPSFFEMNTAMAFLYFKSEKVDVAIIETGLGGRLDSTNIITPVLSVITNISWDHVNFLGNTLPLIAGEKAGIIKKGIPVVIGETHPETAPVFKAKAIECDSVCLWAEEAYSATPRDKSLINRAYWVRDLKTNAEFSIELDALGLYQQKNLVTTLTAIEALQHYTRFAVSAEQVARGLSTVKQLTYFIGRVEVLGYEPLIIADSAHNQAGLAFMVQQLETLEFQNLHVVFGTVNDKDPCPNLNLLPKTKAVYYFAKPDIPRGHEAALLAQLAEEQGLKGKAYGSVAAALQEAKKEAKKNDLILIIGSIFVVAEVL
jgi:dihydrofolate synthase/folylpolyglutamate synthase